MFEDSTFESAGRIRTRSRGWMMAAFLFNGSILLALVLIPLIYPEALPQQWMSVLIEAPSVPAVQPEKPRPVAQKVTRDRSEMDNGHRLRLLLLLKGLPSRPLSIRRAGRCASLQGLRKA